MTRGNESAMVSTLRAPALTPIGSAFWPTRAQNALAWLPSNSLSLFLYSALSCLKYACSCEEGRAEREELSAGAGCGDVVMGHAFDEASADLGFELSHLRMHAGLRDGVRERAGGGRVSALAGDPIEALETVKLYGHEFSRNIIITAAYRIGKNT